MHVVRWGDGKRVRYRDCGEWGLALALDESETACVSGSSLPSEPCFHQLPSQIHGAASSNLVDTYAIIRTRVPFRACLLIG